MHLASPLSDTTADRSAAVARAVAVLRRGQPIVLHGSEAGDADVVVCAESADAEMITFMARYACGLVRLALSGERCDEVGIRPVPTTPGARLRGVGVTIEARTGVTTGISAADRARTIAAAIDAGATPDHLVQPGHIVPLRARAGGILARRGQAEAAVDLAHLAGGSAAVLCHVLDERGDVADDAELGRFCERHGLELISVADVVAELSGDPAFRRRQLALVVGDAAADRLVDALHAYDAEHDRGAAGPVASNDAVAAILSALGVGDGGDRRPVAARSTA